MGTNTIDKSTLEDIVERIVRAVGPEKIILFGSAARGEMNADSDLDLLIVKQVEQTRECARAIRRALWGIPIPIDILVARPEFLLPEAVAGTIYQPAMAEGKVLYRAENP